MRYPITLLEEGSGFILNDVKAGEDLETKKLVYINNMGRWKYADRDSLIDLPVSGITLQAIKNGLKGPVLVGWGIIGDPTWSFTPGAPLYASSTPGDIIENSITRYAQQIGYALETKKISFNVTPILNTINWSNNLRNTYCPVRDLRCVQIKKGGEWWTIDAKPAETKIDNFSSVMSFKGAALDVVIADTPWYASLTGGGTFRANEGVMQGMRVTTGAVNNNDCLLTDGDDAGTRRIWNKTSFPTVHFHYRIPEAGDAGSVSFLLILWEDADNYLGLRYDTSVDNKLRFVTKDGVGAGNEETTDLGILDTDWHELNVKILEGSIKFIIDEGTIYEHTTHIPDGDLAAYLYLKTLEGASKKLDLSHLALTQKHI